jgi:hypothetical protein
MSEAGRILGGVWVEHPCSASDRRGYQRRVVVSKVDSRYVDIAPASGMRGVRSRVLVDDFLRRFAREGTP